ncbi:MAG: hypothetical protein ACREAA_03450 [Candidatus Polarisedimenticolia bacterium]
MRTLAALVFLLASSPALAGEARLYIAPQYVQTHLTGDARVSGDTGVPPTTFSLEDTLGVDPDVPAPTVEGFVKFLGARLSFGWTHSEADGRTTLDELVVFDGGAFLPGQTVETQIDMTRYKLLFGGDFGVKVVNGGFLVGAQLIDISAELTSSTLEEEESMRLPLPAVGGFIGVHPVDWLAIHAELTGISVTLSDVHTKMLDGFAGIDFLLASRVGLGVGYRYFMLDADDEDEDNAVDLVQRGVYVGLSLHL